MTALNTGDSADTLKLEYLAAIRTGAVKLIRRDADGNEQVVGFTFPGELLGFDAVASGRHELEIIALETTAVCLLPYEECLALAQTTPNLLHQLFRSAGENTLAAQYRSALIAESAADERLIAFLRMIGDIHKARGYSGVDFNLPMSRQDIASYLAMAVETVSRLLRKLQDRKIINFSGRHVTLKQDFSTPNAALQNYVAC